MTYATKIYNHVLTKFKSQLTAFACHIRALRLLNVITAINHFNNVAVRHCGRCRAWFSIM